MSSFLELPDDLQHEILRRASVLETFYWMKLAKQIRRSVRHNHYYHSYIPRHVFAGPGLPTFGARYILFSADDELIPKLEELTRLHAAHGHALHFFLKTPRKCTDMPPITRRILQQSRTLHTFNTILPIKYQHWLFEDQWVVRTAEWNHPVGESPADPEVSIDDIIHRMRALGLAQRRMLLNNLLVDLFEQNQYCFKSISKISDDEAVIYLAWIMWWSGNWGWSLRHADYAALLAIYNYNGKITKRDNGFLARLMSGETVFTP